MDELGVFQQIEELVERYLRHDVLEEAERAIGSSVAAYNAWVTAANEASEAASRELEQERASIEEMGAAISRLDAGLEVRPGLSASPREVEAFNARMAERNALAARHRQAVEAHNTAVQEFNREQRDSTRESERQRRTVEETVRAHENARKAYVDWRKLDGQKRLWAQLNEVFARVRGLAGGPVEAPELAKARALRREIAQFAVVSQEKSQSGWLSVEARLGGEPVWLDVDTGTSVVAVSPEMVKALNWSGYCGEPVELQLAGGLRLMAPQLLIPELSVQSHSADHVKGAVVKEPGFGRDGSIGLSFLNRFQYSISGGDGPPRLKLCPRSSPPRGEYDVFVCHKSEDKEPARILFDYLRAEGYRPFFGPVSLGVESTSVFQQGIDRALEDAVHMVVVGSSRANMEASWVRSEWQRYLAMRNMGRKSGNLIVLVCGEMKLEQLPVGLVDCQAISIQAEEWRESIRRYLSR